jgi:hypothetical protein
MPAWLAKILEFLLGGKGTTQTGTLNQTGSTTGHNSPVITSGIHLNAPIVLPEASSPTDVNRAILSLSDEAKKLLLEATDASSGIPPSGIIMLSRGVGIFTILTPEKMIVETQHARSQGRWENAIRQLVAKDFLQVRGYKGEQFAVTHEGLKAADVLRKL